MVTSVVGVQGAGPKEKGLRPDRIVGVSPVSVGASRLEVVISATKLVIAEL